MGGIGLEHSSEKSPEVQQNKELSDTSADTPELVRVQNPVHILQKHSDLKQVVVAWSNLPEHIRQTIMTLVGSVVVKSEETSP